MPDARATSPVIADQAARRRAVDPAHSFIVQAPAGSGKTEILIQRYLGLLARAERPESIAAITFTRKAAGEMRERVLAALRQAAAGTNAESAHHRYTLELARDALARDHREQWNLLANPTRLRLYTIDALCAAIARSIPWPSGFGAMPAIAEDATPLYREAARNTIRLLASGGPFAAAVESLALHLDNNLARLGDMLQALLPKRDQWLRHIGVGADPATARSNLEAELARILQDAVQRARAALPQDEEPTILSLLALSGARPARLDTRDAWCQAANFLLTQKGDWRKRVDRRQGFPPEARFEKARFDHLIERLEPNEAFRAALRDASLLPEQHFTDRQATILAAMMTLLPAAAAELQLVFRETGQVDFVEVAQAAAHALGDAANPTDLGLATGDRIDHILLDEFQDTSLSQLDLIERLTAAWSPGDGRTLFLVGDPMQSVYRFRDAQVGLYLRVRANGLCTVSPDSLLLENNFRSRPEIVDWVNRTFARVFPDREDVALGAVPYTPSQPFREPSDGEAVRIHPFFANDPQAEADTVADLVAAAQGSTAILVRARQHALTIVAELKRRGIRFRAVDLDPLAGTTAINDLLALTRALLHPGDRTAWLAVLRAPWCGATLAELLAISESDDILDAIPDLPHFQRARQVLHHAAARVRRVPLRRCVEDAWIAMGGPGILPDESAATDAARYLDLLDEVEDIEDVEARTTRLFAEPDTEATNLDIMTIHKAKGLEFDNVILPGLGFGPPPDQKPLLRWGEVPLAGGDSALLFAPIEATEDPDDPIFQYLAHLDRQSTKLESARLLYVAATRARERLHLLGHIEETGKPPRSGSLLELLWPAVEEEFPITIEQPPPHQAELPFRPPRQTRRAPSGAGPWPAAGPRPASNPQVHTVPTTETRIGIVTHQCLAHYANIGTFPTIQAIQSALQTEGVPAVELAQATARVERALASTIADPRGRWILGRHEQATNEFAAAVVIEGDVRNCIIDRTFVEDGVRWVIDYKTTESPAGREIESYRSQMERYRLIFQELENRPVRVGLYFPLVGEWREW